MERKKKEKKKRKLNERILKKEKSMHGGGVRWKKECKKTV